MDKQVKRRKQLIIKPWDVRPGDILDGREVTTVAEGTAASTGRRVWRAWSGDVLHLFTASDFVTVLR